MKYYEDSEGEGTMPKKIVKKTLNLNKYGKLAIANYKKIVQILLAYNAKDKQQEAFILGQITDSKLKIGNIYNKLISDNLQEQLDNTRDALSNFTWINNFLKNQTKDQRVINVNDFYDKLKDCKQMLRLLPDKID